MFFSIDANALIVHRLPDYYKKSNVTTSNIWSGYTRVSDNLKGSGIITKVRYDGNTKKKKASNNYTVLKPKYGQFALCKA